MANNNNNKTLNSSITREQSQPRLNTAEQEKNQGTKFLNVPNLRFPEFKGEWKKYKLEDIAKRVIRKNKGNISRLPLTISAQYGLVDQITFFNKAVASSDMSSYYLLKRGEFAYNKSYSSNYPWGAIKRLDKYYEGALSSLYICFAPTELVDSDFLVHYFETTKWYQGISDIAVEGARNHGLLNVAIPDYFGTCHFIPQDMVEQKKIARLLNLIEERIATQNKIIDKLQSLIKGIAYNFANCGKKECLISNCLECHTSTLQESSLSENGQYPAYGASGISGYTENALVHGEAILIIKDGSNVGSVSYAKGDYSVIGTLNYLTAQKGFNLRYLYFCLKVFDFTPYKTGMAIPHIYFKDYGKARIYCPHIDEQNHIAKTLTKLEDKFNIEQDIRLLFLNQKQYLLQQMFI